jgi:hypothetical protein
MHIEKCGKKWGWGGKVVRESIRRD